MLTTNLSAKLKVTSNTIVSQIQRLTDNRSVPVLVALDGRSGSGKSTLSSLIAEKLAAALVRSDDFYSAEVSDAEWDRLTPPARMAIVMGALGVC